MASIEKLIKRAALANAFAHKGKAQVGAVLGHVLSQKYDLKSNIPEAKKQVSEIVAQINKLSLSAQEKKLRAIWPEFFKKQKSKPKKVPDLPNAVKGKVIMRFEPSPSGPLHLGHAYTLGLNSELCRKYNGKLILRIADTNALNIFEPAYEMIPKDAKWVTKNNISKIVLQSSRIKKYYKIAEDLLKQRYAYVCTCKPDNWKKLMLKSQACPCRDLHAVRQLERWRQMLTGKFKEGEAVVRIKTNLEHKNPAMRDWPALRINEAKHPKTGNKYRVWPLMNFAVAIDDHEMGITHTIRAKDHRDNELRQKYIYDFMNWQMPTHIYVGRINFKDMKISSTETRKAIDAGKYHSWDDVRLPTLLAMKKRGYLPDAFIKYAIEIGISENDKTVTKKEFFKLFDSFNRDLVEPIANRFFFVPNPKKIKIENAPEIKNVKVLVHPEKKSRRTINVGKNIWISKDDFKKFRKKEIRLIDLYNIKLNKKAEFTSKPNKDIPRIQWISNENIETEILMPDGKVVKGLAEANVKKLKNGEILQFVRVGFCCKNTGTTFAFAHR